MAVLAATASTNFTTATTWALVDSISYLAAETAAHVVTTAYSGTVSATWTGDTATIDGIGLKLANRTGTTGTITVHLEIATVEVVGTAVTINCSDLPAATTAAADGGWVFFKFAGTVLLVGASVYSVAVKTSSSSQISLFRDGTAGNVARYLRTTTTQAPAAGDDLIIAGEWTAAATVTARTVTMDNTATTDFGSAPTAANSLLTPGVAVCNNGTLTWGTTAATNYYLKLSNSVIIYRVGTWNQGTTGTAMPRDSTAILELDPAADGDYGFLNRGGTRNMQGQSRTSGKNIVSCKLNTDEAANSTSLGVDTDTGWLDNDQIAVASTTRTAGDSELGALNGAAGASSLTVDGFAGTGGGLLVAHSGTSPTQAEVINITRNVKVRSATSTVMIYVAADATATDDWDWVEIYYAGDAVTTKRGVEAATTTGSFNMQFCSVHDCEDNGVYFNGAALNNVTFSSNVMWNLASVAGPAAQVNLATSGTSITIDSNILIKTGVGNGWTLADVGGTFTNNTVVSAASTGILASETSATIGTMDGNVTHSNAGAGFGGAANLNGTVSTLNSWRNSSAGMNPTGAVDIVFEDMILFGNTTDNITIAAACDITLKTAILNGDTTFSTTNGIRFSSTAVATAKILLDNCDFSTVTGIKTAHTNDINVAALCSPGVVSRDSKLGAATEIATQTNFFNNGFVSAEKLDQTAGNHKTWMRYGTLNTDTTISHTASPSMRMTPNNANFSLESATQFNGMKVAVASGATVGISVWTRMSSSGDGAAYNGNQPQLVVKANPALGLDTDTVIQTSGGSGGTWDQMTATSPTAGDDGAWEFVVICDGTAGWVNVDDWAAS